MTQSSKSILKIGLLLYIVVEAITLLNHLKIEGLDFITKFYFISIPMSTIILLAYASDKGEEKLCNMGLLFIGINIVISLLYIFKVVDLSYSGEKIIDKVALAARDISSGAISICGMLALFSIIPNKDDRIEILKVLAVICYIIFTIINVGDNFVEITDYKWISGVSSLFSTGRYILEYSFIVAYLLGKTVDDVAEIKKENPLLQNTTVAPQQIPVSAQIPTTMPQQVTQQVMPQQVTQPVFGQPAMTPGVVQQVPGYVQQPVVGQPVQQTYYPQQNTNNY